MRMPYAVNFSGKIKQCRRYLGGFAGKGFIQQEIVNFRVPSCLLILRCISRPQSISCYGDTSAREARFKLLPKA